MFIANLADGTTVKERVHDHDFQGVYWDDMPDIPIVSLHLTLPGFISLTPPAVTLTNYSRYYFANQAKADVMTISGAYAGGAGGAGVLTHQIIAGIDDEHDFVLYIEVDRKANVITRRFPLSQFKVREESLKRGMI